MKVGLISLGCPKNLVDSEVMLGLAQQGGTSSRRTPAERRRADRQHLRLHRLGQAGVDRHHPRDGASTRPTAPAARLIVTGCMAERYRDELKKEIPEIDARARHRPGARDRRRDHRRRDADDVLSQAQPAPSAPSTRPLSTASADLHLRRRHAAAHGDAEALRLREDRRRLRLQVRVLHHPDAARRVPQPAGRFDRPRSARARGARRQGTAADLAGHDLLRHRPRTSAARSRACCAS